MPNTTKTEIPRGAVRATRRAEFSCDGRRLVAVLAESSWPDTSAMIEVYAVDPTDGIEMFQGYLVDASVPATIRIRAVEALVEVRR